MSELSQTELDAIVTYRADYDGIREALKNGVTPLWTPDAATPLE